MMLQNAMRSLKPAILAVALSAAPIVAKADTLHDALVGAYTHSGLLDQNRALLRAADEDVARAVSALRPIISWSANVTRSITDSLTAATPIEVTTASTQAQATLSLSLLLWDNNRSRLSVEAAKETVLATRQGLISIEQQIFQRAVNAYFNVRRETENVALRQSNLRLITEELRAAEDRFDVGEVTRTDVAQAQARLAEARSGLAAAMGQLVQAQEEYTNVVGHMPGRLAVPGRLPRLERSVTAAKSIAERNHPDLKQARHAVAASDINVDIASRNASPTINAFGSLSKTETFGSSNFNDNLRFGVEASGPIYQGGALASARRSAMANRDAQRGNLHRVRHDVRQNVGSAYARLQSAQAQLNATGQRIRAARVAFEGVREEATLGARTTLDVLNAEQALLDAQASGISAQADSYIAAYFVLSAMGQLTVSGLGLGVTEYDADAYYNLARKAPTPRSAQGRKLDRVIKSLQKN